MNLGALELSENAPTLRSGALVDNRYRVLCTLGLPSECAVTYLATDESEQRPVVLKELFPRRFVARTLNGTSLRPHTSSDGAEFARVLRRFVRDGELLAEIAHPNLARTLGCVEANDTGYWVIEHYAGVSLFEYAALAGERASTLPALDIGLAVLAALEAMHAESLVYRDVSSQRVLVRNDGRPLLLCPSSERYLAGSSRGPTAGFAALELYGSKEVGPWTDVYGCAALLYFLLTGSAPPSAIERASTTAELPALGADKGVEPGLGAAVARGLALAPERRPHSVREFRRLLEAGRTAAAAPRDTAAASTVRASDPRRDRLDDTADSEMHQMPPLRLEGGIVLPEQGESVGNAVRRFALGLIRSTAASDRRDEHADAEPERAVRPAIPAPREQLPEKRPIVAEAAQPRTSALPDREHELADDSKAASLGALSEREPRERINTGLSPQALAALVGERHNAPSRTPLVAAAVILLFVATAGVFYATRGSSAASVSTIARAAGEVATPQSPAVGSVASLAASAPARDSSLVARAGTKATGVQPSEPAVTTRRIGERPSEPERPAATVASAGSPAAAPSASPPADRPSTPSRLASVNIAIPTVAAELRTLPSDLVVAIQTRTANGRESAEQGAYVSAREAFRAALRQLDSIATSYPRSVQLESLRRDITQLDEQTAQACRAENDVRQKRGGKPIPCS